MDMKLGKQKSVQRTMWDGDSGFAVVTPEKNSLKQKDSTAFKQLWYHIITSHFSSIQRRLCYLTT